MKEPGQEAQLNELLRRCNHLKKTGSLLFGAVLSPRQRCRFGLLEQIHGAAQAADGAAPVSALVRGARMPAPVISRGLRQLEHDGLAERFADPADRRRTLVRLTAAGEAERLAAEQALQGPLQRAFSQVGPERLQNLLDIVALIDDALLRETAAAAKTKGGN